MLLAGFCLLLVLVPRAAECSLPVHHLEESSIHNIPVEVLNVTIGYLGPADLVTLGIVATLFYQLIVTEASKKWRTDAIHPRLSLSKVYEAWLTSESRAAKDSLESLLATNLDFIQYHDSLILFKPFNAAKLYYRHSRQHRFTDVPDVAYMGFKWWIKNCAPWIQPNLLRLVLQYANGVRLTESIVRHAIEAGLQDLSIGCMLEHFAEAPLFGFQTLQAVFCSKCSPEIQCAVVRRYRTLQAHPMYTLEWLDHFNLDFEHLKLVLRVLSIDGTAVIPEDILKKLSRYGSACLLIVMKKFPASTLPLGLWSELGQRPEPIAVRLELVNYADPRASLASLVEAEDFNQLPEDQFLSILGRLQAPLPPEHLLHAIERKFDPVILEFTASKTVPKSLRILEQARALCSTGGYSEALSITIVEQLSRNFLHSINPARFSAPQTWDRLILNPKKLCEVDYLLAIGYLATPLDHKELKHALRMQFSPITIRFILWRCTVRSGLDPSEIGSVARENNYEFEFIQRIQQFIAHINTA